MINVIRNEAFPIHDRMYIFHGQNIHVSYLLAHKIELLLMGDNFDGNRHLDTS